MSKISLLSLPSEILGRILEDVVCNPAVPAPILEDEAALTHDREDYLRRTRRDEYYGWATGNRVFFQVESLFEEENPHNLYKELKPSVLLVNRRLRTETLAALRRKKLARSCSLDLIIFREINFIPTWLSLPDRSVRHLDTVKCTIRALGTFQEEEYGRYSGWRGGDAAPKSIVWPFLEILLRFFDYGPRWSRISTRRDRNVWSTATDASEKWRIQDMIIEVLTPEGVDPACFGPPLTLSRRSRKGKNGEDRVVEPTYLLKFIAYEIEILLGMSHYVTQYGDILYTRVGNITIKFDGMVYKHFDLNRRLREEKWRTVQASEKSALNTWKPGVIGERKRVGLCEPHENFEDDDWVDVIPPYIRWSDCYDL